MGAHCNCIVPAILNQSAGGLLAKRTEIQPVEKDQSREFKGNHYSIQYK